jgi:hypothetical protein
VVLLSVHSGLPCFVDAGQQYMTSPACGGLGGGEGVVFCGYGTHMACGGRMALTWRSYGTHMAVVMWSYGTHMASGWASSTRLALRVAAYEEKSGSCRGSLGVVWRSYGTHMAYGVTFPGKGPV